MTSENFRVHNIVVQQQEIADLQEDISSLGTGKGGSAPCPPLPAYPGEITDGMNTYARTIHETAQPVIIPANGTTPVAAAYAFPYDDMCDFSSILIAPVTNVSYATIGFPKWSF
jgi:hypothetical protein